MKILTRALYIITGIVCVMCSNDLSNSDEALSSSNTTPLSSSTPSTTLTYTADLKPLFDAKCVACHLGRHSAFSSYAGVFASKSSIFTRVENGSMPKTTGGISITAEERQTILDWITGGAPE
ncbi:MAG: cytochrome c [Fibrobacterales bacterium]